MDGKFPELICCIVQEIKKSSLLIINLLEGRVDGQHLKYMLCDGGFVY